MELYLYMSKLSIPKVTLVDEYLSYQQKYKDKYGPSTIVLMECGSFFEIYDYPSEDGTEENIYKIADIINLSVSRKRNKNGSDNYSLIFVFVGHTNNYIAFYFP